MILSRSLLRFTVPKVIPSFPVMIYTPLISIYGKNRMPKISDACYLPFGTASRGPVHRRSDQLNTIQINEPSAVDLSPKAHIAEEYLKKQTHSLQENDKHILFASQTRTNTSSHTY